jgi:transposase
MNPDVLVAGPSSPSAAATAPPPCAAVLPDDAAVLKGMIAELLDALNKAERRCEGLQQRLDVLLRRLYGPRAERFNPEQPWLIPELGEADPPTPAATADVDADTSPPGNARKKKGHGRKPLPAELPRQRLEHTLPEAQRLCPCCGKVCQKFGEDITEQLDYQPASLFIVQHVRCKYACQKCHDHVTVAELPSSIIDKGIPGPGLLAHIAASKYADHLPLHRLERILGRHGIQLSRSTMCDWMADTAEMLQPIIQLMAAEVRLSQLLHTDATKMPFLDPKYPGKTLSGQMWVYVGDRDHPFNLFDFCRDHSALGIDTFLKKPGYRGYLNADAINLYDHLFTAGDIIEVGCWAHCRRNFYDARGSDPARSHVVLARIRQLYEVEAEAKELIAARQLNYVEADALRWQWRQERSLPIVTALCHWLQEQERQVLPRSPMGQAIAYALRHWQALTRYLEHGFLAIDNNVAERTLRHIAIGRKNWLFAGSAKGAVTAATLFSVTSSCQRHQVDAFAYLQDVLTRLAHDAKPPVELLRDWLPDRWRAPPQAAADSS